MVLGLGLRVWGSRFGVQGSGLRVGVCSGLSFRFGFRFRFKSRFSFRFKSKLRLRLGLDLCLCLGLGLGFMVEGRDPFWYSTKHLQESEAHSPPHRDATPLPPHHHTEVLPPPPATKRMWHTQDSQGLILAWLSGKSFFQVVPSSLGSGSVRTIQDECSQQHPLMGISYITGVPHSHEKAPPRTLP